MQKLPPISLRDYQNGLLMSVSTALHPDTYLKFLMNFYTDDSYGNNIGDIKGWPGYANLGGTIVSGKSILGMHFLDTVVSNFSYSIATINNSGDTQSLTYYYNGTSWAQIGAVPINWTASLKMRFTTFLDYIYAANGTDTVRSWNGDPATSWGTTNLGSAPLGNLIINFNDHIYIGGNPANPSVLYQSPLPNVTTRAIGTWDTTNDTIAVNLDDNDQLTALTVNGSNMIIFKRRSMYTFNSSALQADPLYNQGAFSQELVQTIKGQTIFFGETIQGGAVFKYAGDYPVEISKPVRKWIDAISTTTYSTIGSFQDDDNYFLSLGNVTLDGFTYSNVVLRYNVPSGTWSSGSFANKPLVGSPYITATGARTALFGTSDGKVMTWNSGTTYDGSAIFSSLRTKEMEWGSRLTIKQLNQFAVIAPQPQNMVVQIYIDGSDTPTTCTLVKNDGDVYYYELGKEGRTFELEIQVVQTSSDAAVIDGFEFFDTHTEGYKT